jgi:hypothetical protein
VQEAADLVAVAVPDDADRQAPGMRAHLEGCPACAEDRESLLAIAADERASDG